MLRVEGSTLYSADGRAAYLDRLSHSGMSGIAGQLRSLYQVFDTTLTAQKQAKAQMLRLGKRYPEIQPFQQVPGIGPIGSHLFDAFIQTPHRFFGEAEALALLPTRHP